MIYTYYSFRLCPKPEYFPEMSYTKEALCKLTVSFAPCISTIKALGNRKLLLLSRCSRVRLCATPQTAARQAPRPWGSPGESTGLGCHFLHHCMKVKSESEVAQSCPTCSNPMDCSPPGSSVHGVFQARGLEWGAIAFSSNYKQYLPK